MNMMLRFSTVLILSGATMAVRAQAIPYNGSSAPGQDFNTLATSGLTNTTLPAGWAFAETGANANTTYRAGDGTGATPSGDTYSLGTGTDVDRAFGGILSGSLSPVVGAQLQNTSGGTLSSILIAYTGEQWRLGTTGRTDRMDFEYSLDATSLTSGTWTAVDALDFNAPNSMGTVGGLDGNAPANRVAISSTVSGLNWTAGGMLWIRWVDAAVTGADDALGIDDVVFGSPVDNPPTFVGSVPADLATNVAFDANIVLTFSESVTVPPTNSQWFTLICVPSNTVYTGSTVVTGSGTNTITLNPATDFLEQEECTLNVTGAQVLDTDGTPNPVGTDPRVGFTIAEDLPPEVNTISPPFGSNPTTPLDANVVLTFSEPVTTTGSWFTIVCPTSGTRDVNNSVVTGTGNTRTINPNVNFANDEICAVTLIANAIEDIDGVPNKLSGGNNYESQFRTVLDVAPTVTTTSPLNNATNVGTASNIVVTFSEAVTATSNAFTLACGAGNLPFALSNTAQTAYTVNPDADLPPVTLCTVTVVAANVLDTDGTPTPMQSNFTWTFTTGQSAGNYYASVDTSSCRALRSTLHGVIDDHHAVVYSDQDNTFTPGVPSTYDVYEIMNDADEDPSNPANILDVYRNASYPKHDSGAVNYNREHVWPNSQGFNDVETLDGFPNPPYTDVQMLMASDTEYNSHRSSRAYGACPGCTDRRDTIFNAGNAVGGNGGTNDDDNFRTATDGGLGRYLAWNFRRGDLARAMFYMDVRYEGGRNSRNFQREPDLILTNDDQLIDVTPNGQFVPVGYSGILSELILWHNGDSAITSQEVLRNDVVASVQGNRNPFVDHPEWVAIAFANPCVGPDLVAVDDTFAATEDTVLNRNGPNDIGVLNDDKVYFGATALTAAIVGGSVSHGSAIVQTNGQFTYTPPANFCGNATFQYTSSNGSVNDTGIANIEIACVNDLPTAVGSLANQNFGIGDAVNIPTAQAFADADADVLVYSMTGAPASLVINPTTGVITGTTSSGDVAGSPYTVTVRASEPSPLTGFVNQVFTITIGGPTPFIFASGFE